MHALFFTVFKFCANVTQSGPPPPPPTSGGGGVAGKRASKKIIQNSVSTVHVHAHHQLMKIQRCYTVAFIAKPQCLRKSCLAVTTK